MRDPSVWSYQTPLKFDVLTASGVPEVFTYTQPTENQAVADVICNWVDRYQVAQYLLGGGVYGNKAVQYPTRLDLFASRAAIMGMHSTGFDGTWAKYEFAKLQATFTPRPAGQPGNNTNAFITVDTENSSEMMSLPGRELKWSTGIKTGKTLSEQQTIQVTKKVHKVTVHQWAFPPFSTFDTKLGGINSDPINWIGRTIGAERLLFDNYHESFDVYVFGIPTFKIELTFLEKMRSWNKFPLVDVGGVAWEEVTPKPFTPTTLAPVFP